MERPNRTVSAFFLFCDGDVDGDGDVFVTDVTSGAPDFDGDDDVTGDDATVTFVESEGDGDALSLWTLVHAEISSFATKTESSPCSKLILGRTPQPQAKLPAKWVSACRS
jgi:hypothetical protein